MLPSNIDQRFERAAKEAIPSESLTRLVLSLKSEGATQLEQFRYFSEKHRLHHEDEKIIDAIADALDYIGGNCGNSEYWVYGRRGIEGS